MHRLSPSIQHYTWGSTTAIPELRGVPASGEPVAELWYGAHQRASATLEVSTGDVALRDYIQREGAHVLGADLAGRFGLELPFLLKLIAPAAPLSLQVHPSSEQAALGWLREERAGLDIDAPSRSFRDHNHKPEMVYALSSFEAVSGFRTPRRALEILDGLHAPLVEKTIERLRHGASSQGMRSAFEYVLLGARDRAHDVGMVVEQIRDRLRRGDSPSEHTDAIALRIADHYPDDRGILASLLLNPVTLSAGEAMYVPAGCVHAYLSGLAVEVMASSDNVVRAGMTPKHVDARTLLDIIDVRPAPPIRLAPERSRPGVEVFYAPVEDFEMAVITVAGNAIELGGSGPRVVLAIEGKTAIVQSGKRLVLTSTEAVFVSDRENVSVSGHGRVVRASVP